MHGFQRFFFLLTLAALAFAIGTAAVSAQSPGACSPVWTAGVSPTGIDGGCNTIVNADGTTQANGARLDLLHAPSVSAGASVVFLFENAPDPAGSMIGLVAIALAPNPVGIPAPWPGSCGTWNVSPSTTVAGLIPPAPSPASCYSLFWLQLPPFIPELAGLQFVAQGMLRDPISGGYCTTNTSQVGFLP